MGGRSLVPLLYASRGGAARMAPAAASSWLDRRSPPPSGSPSGWGLSFGWSFPPQPPGSSFTRGLGRRSSESSAWRFPGPVILSITDNRHSIITHRVQKGVLHVRVHHMFLDAPAAGGRRARPLRHPRRPRRERHARRPHRRQRLSARAPQAQRPARVAKGKHHDLLELFEGINERYFGGTSTPSSRGASARRARRRASRGERSSWEATAPSTA